MSNIKVSVIIPCYNAWKYMGKCLEALKMQTVLPYEVVIVDDCSVDSSFEHLENYAKNSQLNVKIIRNEKNVGPGISRKKAIANATGDYIFFCDCDDWYEENYIELMTKEIEEKSADIVICDNFITYDDRKIVCNAVKPLVGADKKTIIAMYFSALWRLGVKKSLFEEIFVPAIYHGEDAAIVPQIMAKAKNICVLNKPLYNYYFREGSASNTPSKTAYSDFLKAFEAVESIASEFRNECEFIGIKLICYGASLNAFKCGVSSETVFDFMREFKQKYPDWEKNPYINAYNRLKRLYLKFISKNMFVFCRIIASMHYYVTKYRK